MILTFGQDHRRPLRFQRAEHIVEDHIVTSFILRDCRINRGHWRPLHDGKRRRQPERRAPLPYAMGDTTAGGLRPGIDAMADRAALHEDDRLMPILARYRGGQPENEPRLRSPRDKLEARRGQVVTFVDDEMAIIANKVGDFSAPHEALDQRHIDHASRLAFASPDRPDELRVNVEERLQSLDPLLHQFLAMDEYQRIDAASRDQVCGNHRFAERRGRRQNAVVMRPKGFCRKDLRLFKIALEGHTIGERRPGHPLVVYRDRAPMPRQQRDKLIQASARQTDMLLVKLGAGDNARLAERRQAHRLRFVELGILECGKADDLCH